MRFSRDRSLGLEPATVLDYRELARRRLPRQLFDYIDGGAYGEQTLHANVADLEHLLLRQIVMRDVSTRKLAVRVLGQDLSMPVILAPVGLGGMFARRAEVQAARAARAAGIPFVESTVSICGIEEVTAGAGTPPWLQLYVLRDRGYTRELIARAGAVGSPVLVLTADVPVPGARHRDARNALVGEPSALSKLRRGLDLMTHPHWILDVPLAGRPMTFGNLERAVPDARTPADFRRWIDSGFDPSLTWRDIEWVREHWNGPLVLKGVLDREDALRAAAHGVDGIVVSNHGGRQLDSVASSARSLPGIVEAVGGQLQVLADGGVRSGLDVLKLVALGAGAVLIGRAWAWAVAARGGQGVEHVLRILRADLDVALALTGKSDIATVDRSVLLDAAAEPSPA